MNQAKLFPGKNCTEIKGIKPDIRTIIENHFCNLLAGWLRSPVDKNALPMMKTNSKKRALLTADKKDGLGMSLENKLVMATSNVANKRQMLANVDFLSLNFYPSIVV